MASELRLAFIVGSTRPGGKARVVAERINGFTGARQDAQHMQGKIDAVGRLYGIARRDLVRIRNTLRISRLSMRHESCLKGYNARTNDWGIAMRRKKVFLAALALGLMAAPSLADHSWGDYHWARTTSSFNLTIVNSTTPDWDSYVAQAESDWSVSSKLNMVPVDGDTGSTARRQCRAPQGQVRICNLTYGQNGWLGIAGISIDTNGHIVSGYTKLNDTYFSWDYYNNPGWKQSVACQELGHNIGLDHQDEDFDNESLKSCMDYQDPPWPNPNQHDYEQLETIYGHLDSYDSYVSDGGGGGGGGGCNAPPGKGCNKGETGNGTGNAWGISLGRRGQHETFLRIDPDGTRHITFVTWVKGH
jgi:hypothetical protein